MSKIGKRIIIFFCSIFVICSLDACKWLKSEDEINEELIENLILTMENKDKDSFVNLFATNKANVGIWYIYIIKQSEDVNPNYTCWGDGLATPGINIGKKYSELE